MFSAIRRIWKHDRATTMAADVLDILERYECMDGSGRFELTSGFRHSLQGFLQKHATPTLEDKMEAAKGALRLARNGWRTAPSVACGIALMSIYLELHTSASPRAACLIRIIDRWYAAAVEPT